VSETTGTFEEVQDVIPRNAFLMMAILLIATDVFILVCCFIDSIGTPIWMFAATSVIFGGIIVFCWQIKLRICVRDNAIQIRFIKRYEIKFEEIIDHKTGDIGIIRNYSGWGIKKVSFKNFICIGYDRGVSLKLTGRKVVTFSISDPEGFVSLLPSPQGQL